MPERAGLLASVTLALLVLATSLPGPAGAHNPADTLYHPVSAGDQLLVVGGEGTYAYLTPEGEPERRGNVSGEGEILGAPATAGGHAAVLVRTFPDLALEVQGFDEAGPSWRLTIEPSKAQAFGFLVGHAEGFTAFTTEGRQIEITPTGEVAANRSLPEAPTAEPAPAQRGGWWVPLAEELVRVQAGEIVDRVPHGATPTDVTRTDEHVLLSLAHRGQGEAELRVLDASGEAVFNRTLDGLRLGGSPALLDGRIVLGTYDPEGARVLALNLTDGSLVWEHTLPQETAAAPTTIEDQVVVASNAKLTAYDADGDRRWSRPAEPYLASPAVVDGLLVPSSSANQLLAVHANGTTAWTYTDGVAMPSWAHHEGTDENATDTEDETAPQPVDVPAAGIASLVACLAGGALVGSRRPRS